MKLSYILPLAAGSTALVLPSEQVFADIQVEDNHRGRWTSGWYDEAIQAKDELLDSFKQHIDDVTETSKTAWFRITQTFHDCMDDAVEYMDSVKIDWDAYADEIYSEEPGHGRPGHGRRPHHPPHHDHKPNRTVYQLIAESKYTTKLAELISEYDDLVSALNSTKANYTVFAPTDRAFERIPEHAPKPSKEQLKAILEYHVIPSFYPAGRVLASHTAPTLLKSEHLAAQEEPQRISFKISLRGLLVNLYARVVAINIFATNGVIHGIDHLLIPPPDAVQIIDFFPGEFSTLELGLGKTGLLEEINTTDHKGGTLFAPSNFAFKKLGPKVNGFLFSQYGLKYLKALLEYHVVPYKTLYSDAYYGEKLEDATEEPHHGGHKGPKKGLFHADLPTLLKDRSLAVDIARYGRLIEIKVNAFARVELQDLIAEDGVIHTVSDVIIPPKKLGGAEVEVWQGGELEVDDLVERLEPLVAKGDL